MLPANATTNSLRQDVKHSVAIFTAIVPKKTGQCRSPIQVQPRKKIGLYRLDLTTDQIRLNKTLSSTLSNESALTAKIRSVRKGADLSSERNTTSAILIASLAYACQTTPHPRKRGRMHSANSVGKGSAPNADGPALVQPLLASDAISESSVAKKYVKKFIVTQNATEKTKAA